MTGELALSLPYEPKNTQVIVALECASNGVELTHDIYETSSSVACVVVQPFEN